MDADADLDANADAGKAGLITWLAGMDWNGMLVGSWVDTWVRTWVVG